MLSWELFPLLSVCVIAGLLIWKLWQTHRRNCLIRGMLDDADQVEKLLLDCRERMRGIDNLLDRLPADITTGAKIALNNENNIRHVLQIILQHRLWIQEYAQKSPLKNLNEVSRSIHKSLLQLNNQVMRLIEVGNELQASYARSHALMCRSLGDD